MSQHVKGLVFVFAALVLLYGKFSTTYFCGYDDFNETHRAAFEDSRTPSRIFTTTHFGGSKYRPLQRGLTYLTWKWGEHSPLAFRIRNLLFHLACVALVYGIAWLLVGSIPVAWMSAFLFGLHPMANQTVVAAIFTNTAAYTLMFGAFLLFLLSLRDDRRRYLYLFVSLALSLVGVFTYEPVIVVFGFMGGYMALRWFQGHRVTRGYAMAFAAGTAPILLAFIAVRHIVVKEGMPPVSVAVQVHNVLTFAAGLLNPFDFVLSTAIFHTPLPSDIHIPGWLPIAAGLAAAVVAVVVAIALRRPAVRSRVSRVDWPLMLFLAACIPMTLTPFLFFTPHPSETYLYAPAALYAILLSSLLCALFSSRVRIVIVAALAISFLAADLVRNSRVEACGAAAQTTLSQLPEDSWRQGPVHVYLATPQGQEPGPRYGIYGYSGLSSIEVEGLGIRSADSALRVATGNDQVVADVVPPEALNSVRCSDPGICFWVNRDGSVSAQKSASGVPPPQSSKATNQ